MAENVNIKNKRLEGISAPTPQNTPATSAPIGSVAREPTVEKIDEEGNDKPDVSSLAQNPAVLSMIQGKLNNLVGKSSGYIESLPASVRRRLLGVQGLQVDHQRLENEFQAEILALEKKYLLKYQPLYDRRAAIVNGRAEPTMDEMEKGNSAQPIVIEIPESTPDDREQGIPEFWLTAMKNNIILAELITVKDEEALKSLVDVRCQYFDKPGFKLEFEFKENEFFSNHILTKTYYYQEEVGYGGDFVYSHAEGTLISWKEGKNLTVKVETKKQRNKNTNQTRTIKKTYPTDSFFNFFKPPQALETEEIDDELDEKLELDYQLGEDFKEKLIPRTVDWFTGAALAYEALDDEDDFDEDDAYEDEPDSDLEEIDEVESEEEGSGQVKQDPNECKQS